MCENCQSYNPCISICPRKTCDNRLVYDTLTQNCGQETCVEGCDVEPCPPGKFTVSLWKSNTVEPLYTDLSLNRTSFIAHYQVILGADPSVIFIKKQIFVMHQELNSLHFDKDCCLTRILICSNVGTVRILRPTSF